ncbi:hypothetical protein [Nocardioides sp.]|uniref:hypothetical protein n=1 Tax=Nocardioides sp. TaxID=35761 RepID=UPI000C9899CF|nr:hypothetical protein [Nocardioides sp.]MAS56059.1 hypothetical protein [Pimelobacter sp.]MDE0776223.1 hypothetical protein [Nocardioides sp.]
MSGRIFLHVGLQKTGTSYLQGIVFQSVAQLADQGVAVVPATKRRMFWLMLDVRGRIRPDFDPPEVAASVDRFAAELARTTAPTALVSEESLAPATDEQIERLLAACGDREVHVVVTLRDLARQIPSAWQESLKAGASYRFDDYLDKLRRQENKPGHHLWRQKDVPRLLGAWSRHVPVDRIHVVTVPPEGSDPALLLERFCEVIGVEPARLDRDVVRKNEGLKHVGAEVLRRVNEELAPTHRKRDVYGDVGKRYLSTQILARQQGERIRIPERRREWTQRVSQSHIDYIRTEGFGVVGDLADLQPGQESFAAASTQPSEAEVSAVAAKALAVVIGDEMDRRRALRSTPGSAPGAPTSAPGLRGRILSRLRR